MWFSFLSSSTPPPPPGRVTGESEGNKGHTGVLTAHTCHTARQPGCIILLLFFYMKLSDFLVIFWCFNKDPQRCFLLVSTSRTAEVSLVFQAVETRTKDMKGNGPCHISNSECTSKDPQKPRGRPGGSVEGIKSVYQSTTSCSEGALRLLSP